MHKLLGFLSPASPQNVPKLSLVAQKTDDLLVSYGFPDKSEPLLSRLFLDSLMSVSGQQRNFNSGTCTLQLWSDTQSISTRHVHIQSYIIKHSVFTVR